VPQAATPSALQQPSADGAGQAPSGGSTAGEPPTAQPGEEQQQSPDIVAGSRGNTPSASQAVGRALPGVMIVVSLAIVLVM
jgi:hypothetical protein